MAFSKRMLRRRRVSLPAAASTIGEPHSNGGFVLCIGLILLVLFNNCRHGQRADELEDILTYRLTSAQSGSLQVEASLQGLVKSQELELTLDLSNPVNESVRVKEIIVSTPKGLRSSPINIPSGSSLILLPSHDTTLHLVFRPLNDLALYHLTGINGSFKSTYHVSVLYALQSETTEKALMLTLSLPENKYREYEKSSKRNIAVYSFNTTGNFSGQQSAYLEQVIKSRSSFTHITNHEIIISGLNIRLQAYQQEDSVCVKLIFINHADFSVSIDTASLGLHCGGAERNVRNLRLKKITGNHEVLTVLEKGERLAVSMNTYLKDPVAGSCYVSFHKSVLIMNEIPLFFSDVELIKTEIRNL